MALDAPDTTIKVTVVDNSGSETLQEQSVADLLDDIRTLDIEVDHPAAPLPAGSKGSVDAESLSHFVLAVSAASTLRALVPILKSWIEARAGRKIRLEIDKDSLEITGQGKIQSMDVIQQWLDKHGD